MTKLSWNKLPLKDLFRLDTTSCLPASQPEQAFLHHSIPAWDESGGPFVELGNTIGSNKFMISDPCVLVSKLNPRKSRVSVVRDLRGEFPQCASTEFMVYVPIHEDADIGFYGWYMTSEYFQGELKRVATGTTNSHVRVTPKETLNWKIAQPPLPEQRRIAEILDTIDEAIQKTEALISKLKAMKQGLLHDLLTRGLDENGKLRDPKAHPEQFKDSPLGRIPKEWEPFRLLDLASIPNGQVDPKQKPYCHWPLIAPDHIESDTGRLLCLETAIEQGAISGKYAFKPGDVLYSKIRPYLRKAVLADRQGLCSADMYPLQPGTSLVPRFLLDVILGEHFSRFAASVSERSGFPKINRKELGEYRLALPPRNEQLHIASVMDTHDARIRTEEQYREKLKLQKKGLMHDLLTGKVEVRV